MTYRLAVLAALALSAAAPAARAQEVQQGEIDGAFMPFRSVDKKEITVRQKKKPAAKKKSEQKNQDPMGGMQQNLGGAFGGASPAPPGEGNPHKGNCTLARKQARGALTKGKGEACIRKAAGAVKGYDSLCSNALGESCSVAEITDCGGEAEGGQATLAGSGKAMSETNKKLEEADQALSRQNDKNKADLDQLSQALTQRGQGIMPPCVCSPPSPQYPTPQRSELDQAKSRLEDAKTKLGDAQKDNAAARSAIQTALAGARGQVDEKDAEARKKLGAKGVKDDPSFERLEADSEVLERATQVHESAQSRDGQQTYDAYASAAKDTEDTFTGLDRATQTNRDTVDATISGLCQNVKSLCNTPTGQATAATLAAKAQQAHQAGAALLNEPRNGHTRAAGSREQAAKKNEAFKKRL